MHSTSQGPPGTHYRIHYLWWCHTTTCGDVNMSYPSPETLQRVPQVVARRPPSAQKPSGAEAMSRSNRITSLQNSVSRLPIIFSVCERTQNNCRVLAGFSCSVLGCSEVTVVLPCDPRAVECRVSMWVVVFNRVCLRPCVHQGFWIFGHCSSNTVTVFLHEWSLAL